MDLLAFATVTPRLPRRDREGTCQEAYSTAAASALQGLVMFQAPAPRLQKAPPLPPGDPILWGSCRRPAVSLLPYGVRGNGFHSCVSEATADSMHVLDLFGQGTGQEGWGP